MSQPDFQAIEADLEREWRNFAARVLPGSSAAAGCRALRARWEAAELAELSRRLRESGPERGFEPPARASAGRLSQWAAGREALLAARGRLPCQSPGARLENISHTESPAGSWAAALALLPAPKPAPGGPARPLGIGIDIESAARAVKPELRERVSPGPGPGSLDALPLIEVWVILEACFKAHPANAGHVVWQARVAELDAVSGEGVARLGGFPETIRFGLLRIGAWRIATAICLG
jgi:hypothetical protein